MFLPWWIFRLSVPSSPKGRSRILNKPSTPGLKNAGVLAQMAVMALLLKRISRFIVKVTLAMRKILSSNSQPLKPYLPGPDIPKFIVTDFCRAI